MAFEPDFCYLIFRVSFSPGKIVGFYLIFYLILAIFVGVFFKMFSKTLNNERPKYMLRESLIGDNPGLGFRPMPAEDHIDSSLIFFSDNAKSSEFWIETLDDFFYGEIL